MTIYRIGAVRVTTVGSKGGRGSGFARVGSDVDQPDSNFPICAVDEHDVVLCGYEGYLEGILPTTDWQGTLYKKCPECLDLVVAEQ